MWWEAGSNPYWFNENQKKRVSLPKSQYTDYVFDPDHEAWAADWVNCPEASEPVTFDWIHPDISRQKNMAEKWFKAFMSKRSVENPKFQPVVEITNKTDSTVTLRWSPAIDNGFVAGHELMVDGKLANYACSNAIDDQHSSVCNPTHKNSDYLPLYSQRFWARK